MRRTAGEDPGNHPSTAELESRMRRARFTVPPIHRPVPNDSGRTIKKRPPQEGLAHDDNLPTCRLWPRRTEWPVHIREPEAPNIRPSTHACSREEGAARGARGCWSLQGPIAHAVGSTNQDDWLRQRPESNPPKRLLRGACQPLRKDVRRGHPQHQRSDHLARDGGKRQAPSQTRMVLRQEGDILITANGHQCREGLKK